MFSNLFYFLRLLFAASPALVIGELAWGVLTDSFWNRDFLRQK